MSDQKRPVVLQTGDPQSMSFNSSTAKKPWKTVVGALRSADLLLALGPTD